MSLLDQLSDDMKQAMKDKDKIRLSVIRMVRAAAKNKEIDSGAPLTDEDVIAVVQKELKQRRDSLQAFESAGRTDLVDDVTKEMVVLQEYLPKQLSQDEVRAIAAEVITEIGAVDKSAMGKVMSAVMGKVRGQADGKLVQQVVQSLLSTQ